VWEQANATSTVDGGAKWWAYAHLFTTSCHTETTWNAECSYAAMRQVGIDDSAVRACVVASNATAEACATNPSAAPPGFCTIAPYTNILLQWEMDLAEDQGVWLLPSARVEDVLVVGGMTPRAVLGAICSAFPPAPGPGQTTAPPLCGCLLQPTDAELQACATGANAATAKTPGWAVALAVVGSLSAVASAAALWWVRRTRTELRTEMESYMALAEGPKEGAGDGGVGGEGGAGTPAARGVAVSGGGGWLRSFFTVPGAGVGWQRVGESAAPSFAAPSLEGGSLNNLPPATDM
jgi:hypothetical protein